ncbi:MAG: hypothetical protein V3W41_14695 [Planctomycetota bacterium]
MNNTDHVRLPAPLALRLRIMSRATGTPQTKIVAAGLETELTRMTAFAGPEFRDALRLLTEAETQRQGDE